MTDGRDLREALLSIAREGAAEGIADSLRLDERGRARVLAAVDQQGPGLVAQGIHPDHIQARLSDLADESSPRMDATSRASLLRQVEREGPALVRAARRRRITRWLLPAAAAVALAPITYVLFSPGSPDARRRAAAAGAAPSSPGPPADQAETPPREVPSRETTPASAAQAGGALEDLPVRACERWSPAAAAVADSGRIDLGARGHALVRGRVSVTAVSGCATELSLRSGRVRVHAQDLGGGSLTVLAGQTSVEVWGTRFLVARDGPEVRVEVIEGHVVVRAPGERELHLRAGERWVRGERGAAGRTPSDPRGVERVSSRTGQVRPPRTDRSIAQLAQAETLWRGGRRDRARALFREVGRGRTARAAAAWVRLARLELRVGNPGRAVHASRAHRARFPRSPLGAEALFIEVDALRRLGRDAESRAAAERLRSRYPSSPQARALAQTGDAR